MNLLARTHGMEFGWLITTFVPYLRHKASEYNKVVIACRRGEEYLYEFASDFEYIYENGRSDRWLFNDKKIKMPLLLQKKYNGYKQIVPTRRKCTKDKRKFRKYGEYTPELKYDLVIHARSEAKYDREDRNWPKARYIKLLKELRKNKELAVCSIGTKKGAYHIKGTEDLRDISLKQLCNILASSRLCIGVSSGPMHLASHCGCPHVVWTDNRYQKSIGGTNKKRYKKLWNPFKTHVMVIDEFGWKPPVEEVVGIVRYKL